TDLGRGAIPRPPRRTHSFGTDLPEGCSTPEDPWMIAGPRLQDAATKDSALSVREAIGDLPRQTEHLAGKVPEERRLPARFAPAPRAAILRQWPKRRGPEEISGNWYRSTPRDYGIFRDMAHGDVYPNALAIAHRHAWRAMLSDLASGVTTDTERIRSS